MKTLKEQQVTSLSELLKMLKKQNKQLNKILIKKVLLTEQLKISTRCLKSIGRHCLMKINNTQCGMMVS